MKIDIYNHIFPMRYFEKMIEVAGSHKDMGKRVRDIPFLIDLDERFRVMDTFGEYCQVLSLASPPLEVLAGPDDATELAQRANDGMAELVGKHPDRFPAFTASLPMNAPEAALAETRRAIDELGAKGVQVFSNAAGKPLDAPEFAPIFDAMAGYDLPIWLHPARGANFPDYASEEKSKYEIWWTFGWPYETSVAMARLVFSGLFDRHPEIKIITHHMGAMAPYNRTSDEDYFALLKSLKKRPIDYFRQFYADTALFGSDSGTRCGLDFFGVDKVVFASDSPFDPEKGPMYIRETIRVIDGLDISDAERDQIYRGNANRLLGLSIG
jgi:aminocarboxymuconate-semialdehyde decarboxylase